MAAVRPVNITQHEWMLLRNLSFHEFRRFMTDVEDLGIFHGLTRLRQRFPREIPALERIGSNGG
jgi:hypothetical protein